MSPLAHRGHCLAVCLGLVLFWVSSILAQLQPPVALCSLRPTAKGTPFNIHGTVSFVAIDFKNVQVVANIYAELPNGAYSMSIFEFGDITDQEAGLATGGIFVGPIDAPHSCPPNPRRKEGDMGNWTLVNNNIAMAQTLTLLSLTSPLTSIVGRAVVLRAQQDNCTGVDGYAGDRLAQCVIGIANQLDNQADRPDTVTNAICSLQPTSSSVCNGKQCNGTVWFNWDPTVNLWAVTATVSGLTPGFAYGFHIHQYGDLSQDDGSSAGAHFNPFGHYHNLPPVIPRHLGDLGALQTFAHDGTAWYRFADANLKEDISQLIGRAMVIHSGVDHGAGLGCDQSGNSGPRVMWCVIGVAGNNWVGPPTVPSDVVVDNIWKSTACAGDGGGNTGGDGGTDGKVVAIIVGWLLAVFFFFTTVGFAAYWWNSTRAKKDYTELAEVGRSSLSADDEYKNKYKRRYGRY